jgi:SAM-dependent methyltransferase
MLSLARKLNPENEYVYGDMRTVRLERQFDAVTIFDSINYMCSVDDLQAAFRTAYEHLRTGGVLITVADEWREKFIQNKTIHLTRQRGDIEITLIENYYDPDPGDSWYEDNIIFLIRRAGQLRIETDYHRLGLFDLSQWTAAIEAAGFEASQISSSISNGAGEHCPVFVGRRH